MAKRKSNPESKLFSSDVNRVILNSPKALRLVSGELYELEAENAAIDQLLDGELSPKHRGIASKKQRDNGKMIRAIRSAISQYKSEAVSNIEMHVKRIMSSPAFRDGMATTKDARALDAINKAIFRLKIKERESGAISGDLAAIRTSIERLYKSIGPLPTERGKVDGDRERINKQLSLYDAVEKHWKKVSRRAKGHSPTMGDVEWVTAQLRGAKLTISRGNDIAPIMSKIIAKIRDIENRTKHLKSVVSYQDSADALDRFDKSFIGDEPLSYGEVNNLLFALEKVARKFSAKGRSGWTDQEKAKYSKSVSRLRAKIKSLKPAKGSRRRRAKGNPCIGLHFHAKDADQILKAAKSNSTCALKPKGNPKAKRVVTPKWKLLINRCQSLWTAYCKNDTKKNLKLVFVHLDKMSESTSKRVGAERSTCLRHANKEAKRIGLKLK